MSCHLLTHAPHPYIQFVGTHTHTIPFAWSIITNLIWMFKKKISEEKFVFSWKLEKVASEQNAIL